MTSTSTDEKNEPKKRKGARRALTTAPVQSQDAKTPRAWVAARAAGRSTSNEVDVDERRAGPLGED